MGRISAENKLPKPKDNPNQPRDEPPQPNPQNPHSKNEWKLTYLGMASDEITGSEYVVFSNSIMLLDSPIDESDIEKSFYIKKNHPRIKQLLGEGKLRKDKQFIFLCGKNLGKTIRHFFGEDNRDLEIMEV